MVEEVDVAPRLREGLDHLRLRDVLLAQAPLQRRTTRGLRVRLVEYEGRGSALLKLTVAALRFSLTPEGTHSGMC